MRSHFLTGALFFTVMLLVGAELPKPVLLPPARIQSVNGSRVDTKCSWRGAVNDCLSDGHVPHINTSLQNWASDLVTVRKSPYNESVPFDHIVLTFKFETSVNVTSIEIDLFLCPEWGIGAPYIAIFADNHSQFEFNANDFLHVYEPDNETCGCLSKIFVPVQRGEPHYPYWHILVDFTNAQNLHWVHVGEVTFSDTPIRRGSQPTISTDCTFQPPPDSEYFPAVSSVVAPVNSQTLNSIPSRAAPTPLLHAPHIIVKSLPPYILIPPFTPVPSYTTEYSNSIAATESTAHLPLTSSVSSKTFRTTVPSMIASTPTPYAGPIPTTTYSLPPHHDTSTYPSLTPVSSPTAESSLSSHDTSPLPTTDHTTASLSSILFTPSLSETTTLLGTASPSIISSTSTRVFSPSVASHSSSTVADSVLLTSSVETGVLSSASPSVLASHITASVVTSIPSTASISNMASSVPTSSLVPDTHKIPTKLFTTVLPDDSQSTSATIPTLKTNSIPTRVATNLGFTPSVHHEDFGSSATLVSSLPHSTREMLYLTSAPTTLSPSYTSESLFATRITNLPLPASTSFPTLSPTPSSHTSQTATTEDNHPTIGEPVGLAYEENEKVNFPLLILIFLLVLISLVSLVVAVLTLFRVYFRRRESIRLKMAKFRSSHHEISVFNPLYVSPSVLTEGVYQDAIEMCDFTDDHGLSISSTDSCLKLQMPPLFLGPNVFPWATQPLPEISSENFTELDVLGSGHFGEVVLAHTKGLCLRNRQLVKAGDDEQESQILVAVKKLQSNPSQTEREVFDKEIKFVSHITHPNILRLLGVCHSDPAFIMMEYTEGGDLNQFLQSYSEIVTTTSHTSQTQISTSTLLYMASQISNAMQYLAGFDYVHRDIATRKCLVGKNFLVKLSDLGVNMNTYQSHYYCISGDKLLPIRWMATECFSGKFSEKSDVWAFGVTMWELFTLAKDLPYPHLSDEEVIHNALQIEHFLPPTKPNACPQAVYQIMQQCWAINLQHRATFQEINEMFKTCI